MPLAPGIRAVRCRGRHRATSELAPIDRDIAAQAEPITHQAALIALLEAAGECTILADAQLGAMEQGLSALWVRRETARQCDGRATPVVHDPDHGRYFRR